MDSARYGSIRTLLGNDVHAIGRFGTFTMNKLVIYKLNDWTVLYVNGKLVYQNHSLRDSDLAEYTPIESIDTVYVSDHLYPEEHFDVGFPDTLDKVEEFLRVPSQTE